MSPPLSEPSSKRILPALFLGGTFCAHRFYVGKYFTGMLQILWVFGSFAWLVMALRDLFWIMRTGNWDFAMLEQMSDWEQTHQTPLYPMLSLVIVGLWIGADISLLMAGKFKDRTGKKISRW